MAHKDNIKNAENAARRLANAEDEIPEEVAAPPPAAKTGHHTGCVQIVPKVGAPSAE